MKMTGLSAAFTLPVIMSMMAIMMTTTMTAVLASSGQAMVAFDSTGTIDCVNESWRTECRDYRYPNATADLERLCKMMWWMPGCTLRSVCTQRKLQQTAGFCHDFSLLEDICVGDRMGGMGPCRKNYLPLCHPTNATSQVAECHAHPATSTLPTTAQSQQSVEQICLHGSHAMEECNMCKWDDPKRRCNYFEMLVALCKAMPDMEQCEPWRGMCAKSSALSGLTDFCLEGMDSSTPYEGSLPPMRMYFHNGWSEIMWFRGWVPKTERDYWLAVAVVVLMGIVYELIHTIRCVYEFKWAVNIEAERIRKQTLANIHAANSVTAPLLGYKGETVPACCQPDGPSSASNVTLLNINAASSASPCCNTTAATGEPCCTSQTTATARKLQTISGTLALAQPFRFGVDFMRAAFQAIETTLGYLLMLIAMTFNTGLFIAVVAGMAIGTFVFARFRLNDAMRSCCG